MSLMYPPIIGDIEDIIKGGLQQDSKVAESKKGKKEGVCPSLGGLSRQEVGCRPPGGNVVPALSLRSVFGGVREAEAALLRSN